MWFNKTFIQDEPSTFLIVDEQRSSLADHIIEYPHTWIMSPLSSNQITSTYQLFTGMPFKWKVPNRLSITRISIKQKAVCKQWLQLIVKYRKPTFRFNSILDLGVVGSLLYHTRECVATTWTQAFACFCAKYVYTFVNHNSKNIKKNKKEEVTKDKSQVWTYRLPNFLNCHKFISNIDVRGKSVKMY